MIVSKYDLNDNFICNYNSLLDTGKDVSDTKDAFKNISLCIRGITKSAYGFKWKVIVYDLPDEK